MVRQRESEELIRLTKISSVYIIAKRLVAAFAWRFIIYTPAATPA